MSPRDVRLEASTAPQASSSRRSHLTTSLDSVDAAEELAATSSRRTAIPIRKGFVRSLDDVQTPPMAAIYAGGRSGLVAIKLYVALIWRCSAPPFEADKPARAWATLLDLPDPTGRGARRIRHALSTLEQMKLVELADRHGYPSVVKLAIETGSGAAYTIPSTSYQRSRTPEQRATHVYFKVPRTLWTDGWFQALSGPATTMLLILLAEQADTRDVWWSTEQFPLRYRISHKARSQGTAELRSRGLLSTTRQSLSAWGSTSVFDSQRMRTLYRLIGPAAVGAAGDE